MESQLAQEAVQEKENIASLKPAIIEVMMVIILIHRTPC